MIETPPDPNLEEAQRLAEEIRKRQMTVRIRGGIGYSALPSTLEERLWLNEYGIAETALRKARREAERQARRSR